MAANTLPLLPATLCSPSRCPSAPSRAYNMLLSLCRWLQDTSISTGIRESVWVFPIIETVHLLALAFSVGIILFVDLRLVGATMTDSSVSEVFGRLQPIAVKGFAINFLSGILLFWSEPL